MNFTFGWCLGLLLVVAALQFCSAGTKKYTFVQAKCVEYPTAKQIGGPLKLCTFPPKHRPLPQEDIDAVIEYIQTHEFPHRH